MKYSLLKIFDNFYLDLYIKKMKKNIDYRIFILIIVILSVSTINRYEFGVDYSVLLPFVKKIINPNLYQSDYFIEQMKHYPTLLWYIIGYLCKITHIKLEILLFIFYFISIYFFFLGFYHIAKIITDKDDIAYLSLFLLLFSKQSFALVETITTSFYNRTPVLPILIFSIYYFLKKEYYLSYILSGVGFLIHPMSAFYVVSIIFVASLFEIKNIGLKKFIMSILVFTIISSPIFIFWFLNKVNIPFFPDNNWLELLRLRSSHHIFPLSWDKRLFIQGFFIIIAFSLSLKYKPEMRIYRNLLIFFISILIFCITGTIFTEFIPLTPILMIQLYRSFIYLIYFSIIMVSNFYYNAIYKEKNYLGKIANLFLIFLLLFDSKNWEIGFLLMITLSAFVILSEIKKRKELLLRKTNLIILSFVIIVSFYSLIVNTDSEKEFWWKDWKDVQVWARKNTNINDVFIVPPHLWGFRVYSERSIYTDWKDGTMLNFNPYFGYEWIRRMKNLGFEDKDNMVQDYKELNEEGFLKISEEIFKWKNNPEAVYIVVNKGRSLGFREVYKNNLFTIFEIKNKKSNF